MIEIKYLIGLDEDGKNEYIKGKRRETDFTVSVNDLSASQYGQLFLDLRGKKLEKVKKLLINSVYSLMKDLSDNIKDNYNSQVFIDLLNIDRKMRAKLYENIRDLCKKRRIDFSVEAIFCITTLEEVYSQLKESLDNPNFNFVKNSYINIEIPRIGVDCDIVTVVVREREGIVEQAEININKNHDNVHHKESLATHRDMVLAEGELVIDQVPIRFRDDFMQLLKFHDSGKGLARTAVPKSRMSVAKRWYAEKFVENKMYYQYIGHQRIGAVLLLSACLLEDGIHENLDKYILDKAEIINQHMQAHIGFSDDYKERFNLSEDMVKTLILLAHCDETGRIVDQDQLDYYNSLIEESAKK